MSSGQAETWFQANDDSIDPYPVLREKVRTGVCIIGGGFTGLAAAIILRERGHDVVLLEQKNIGWGASGRSGGQVVRYPIRRKTLFLRRPWIPESIARHLAFRGHSLIENFMGRYAISCDLIHGCIEAALRPAHLRHCEENYRILVEEGMGDHIRLVDQEGIREYLGTGAYMGGLINRRNSCLHPLKLCRGEAAAAESLGVKVYEHSAALQVDPVRRLVRTATGEVQADKIVLAGNAYYQPGRPPFGGHIFPANTWIMATSPLSREEANAINPHRLGVIDMNRIVDYWRITPDRRMLFGGRNNLTLFPPAGIGKALFRRMIRLFPSLQGKSIDFAWGGKVGVVPSGIPLISRLHPDVVCAAGYTGHGISFAHAAGEIVADALEGNTTVLEYFEKAHPPGGLPVPWFNKTVLTLGEIGFRLLDRLS